MMKRLLPILLLLLVVPARTSFAHTQPKARIALHVQSHVTKVPRVCGPSGSGGFAPTDLPCSQYQAAGDLKTPYNVYLVVARGDSMAGLAGVSCGIDYDERWGEGIDVFDWYLCGDLEVRGKGPNGIWPAAQGGNMVLWPTSATCQRSTVAGYEEEGVHAIAGAFYVFAYGPDTLRITPNTTRADLPRLTVSDCQVFETELQEAALGSAVFGGGKGCNPCLGPCAPIPECDVDPVRIDFGLVPIGTVDLREFSIHNNGPVVLRGIVSFDCQPAFYILSGGGPYILEPGETRKVVVAFAAANTQRRTCTEYVANRCQAIELVGQGTGPLGGENKDLKQGTSPSDRFQGISFRVSRPGPVHLLVFDVNGRRIHEESSVAAAGWNEVVWDAGDLPSGVYFYRLEHAGGILQTKFLLLR